MLARLAVLALLLVAPLAEAGDRAVLVYPRERVWFRKIFYTSHQEKLQKAIAERYALSVHEQVATDEELFAIDVDGVKLLVLSAHGDPYSMYFASRKQRTLDWSDRERLAAFLDRLDPQATIVLQSCHTGQGFAQLVKELAGPGRRVIAARGSVPRNGLHILSLAPFDAAMRCQGEGRRTVWDCTVRFE